MILCPITLTLIPGEPFPPSYPLMPSPAEVAANALQWREVAARMVAGEFDSKCRPPTGFLAKAIWIGMRGQDDDPAVAQALRLLGKLVETDN